MTNQELAKEAIRAQVNWGQKGLAALILVNPFQVKEPPFRLLQGSEEFEAFLVEMLAHLPERHVALEIGLFDGGTHLIWRHLFERVVSVDVSYPQAHRFVGGIEDIQKSRVIVGNSMSPATVVTVRRHTEKPVDLLFIDGDHSYQAVEADYMNYEPLVRSGGLVVFHDMVGQTGPVKFVRELLSGNHVSSSLVKGVEFRSITPVKYGIQYYVKP